MTSKPKLFWKKEKKGWWKLYDATGFCSWMLEGVAEKFAGRRIPPLPKVKKK